jgi:hypothetical protein
LVTFWECGKLIFIGATPYPGMTNSEAAEKIMGGYRLGKPDACPDDVYNLMQRCWEEKAKDRPAMKEIHAILNEIRKGL